MPGQVLWIAREVYVVLFLEESSMQTCHDAIVLDVGILLAVQDFTTSDPMSV